MDIFPNGDKNENKLLIHDRIKLKISLSSCTWLCYTPGIKHRLHKYERDREKKRMFENTN